MTSTVNDFLHVIYDQIILIVVRIYTEEEENLMLTGQNKNKNDPKASFKYYPDFQEEDEYIVVEDFHIRNKSWQRVGENCRELILKKRDNFAVKRRVIQFNVDLTGAVFNFLRELNLHPLS